jgi:hypothetical protein
MKRGGVEVGTVILRSTLDDYRKDHQIAAHAKRLALELECLLLSTKDTAAQSRWWDSAHEALDQYRSTLDELYPQPYVSPFGKD